MLRVWGWGPSVTCVVGGVPVLFVGWWGPGVPCRGWGRGIPWSTPRQVSVQTAEGRPHPFHVPTGRMGTRKTGG